MFTVIVTGAIQELTAGTERYPYMEQLLALASKQATVPCHLPLELQDIVTPLRLERWAQVLAAHPDGKLREFILEGIAKGFRVGYDYSNSRLICQRGNMLSALDHPQVVDDYLAMETSLGRVGSIPQEDIGAISVHTSPFGVIPKKSRPGKWRLILDLSSPHGKSVNDGIEKELCTMSYVSIDRVTDCVVSFPPGDIQQAYRNIPVHPQDRQLLGMQWEGIIFVDKVLPFGLRSAPLLFSAVADALQWAMEKNGARSVFHYLDDYITLSQAYAKTAWQ